MQSLEFVEVSVRGGNVAGKRECRLESVEATLGLRMFLRVVGAGMAAARLAPFKCRNRSD